MANGEGSASCRNCRHLCRQKEADVDIARSAICRLWNKPLPFYEDPQIPDLSYLIPPEEFLGTENIICKSWEPDRELDQQEIEERKRVFSSMDKGLLYAVGYPDIADPLAYHRVVCVLDDNSEILHADRYWHTASVEGLIGKDLLVSAVYGGHFLPDDDDEDAYGEKFVRNNFHIELDAFWAHQGLRYGGVGRVTDSNHICNGYWVIFSIYKAGVFDFNQSVGTYIVRLGAEKYTFWNDCWPIFKSGSPRFYGVATIKSVQEG